MSNLLQYSKSPYLLQHKNNPVQWHEWSQETLQKAKVENKIIIVSIGYSTCHWCHVMAHECFENDTIANLMNQYFISIKIDREERPDLDHYFMSAIQMMGISGGWPLNCFMTPDQKVFYGGTYFPPVSKYGRISWPDVLSSIQNSFINNKVKLLEQANHLTDTIKNHLSAIKTSKKASSTILNDSLISLESFIDKEYGGMGFGQKFPNTMALEYIIKMNQKNKTNKYSDFIQLSIKNLCLGGMYDHIQGAFFRYTVDRQWKVPHFEKMAYDHALIIGLLSTVISNDSSHYARYFVKRSFQFWESEMQTEEGLFYAALDADSEGEEGLYYLWTKEELQNVINQSQSKFFEYVELEEMHGAKKQVLNLFRLDKENESHFEIELSQLKLQFELLEIYRSKRERPSTDFKLILSWNALIATAYAKAYLAQIDDEYKNKATQLVEKLLTRFRVQPDEYNFYRIATPDGQLYQSAFLEDYVYLAEAICLLYQITGDEKYFKILIKLMDTIENIFPQQKHIFSFNSKEQKDSFCDSFDLTDSSIPNPNAKLAELYYYMAMKTNEMKYFDQYNLMMDTALSNINGQYYSHISWLQNHPDILKNKKILKTKDWNTVSKFTESMDKNEFVYIYTEDMKVDLIQLCTQELCMMPCESKAEFVNQLRKITL